MINFRCKNCKWWDNEHLVVKTIPVNLCKEHPGICRKHKPGAMKINGFHYGIQPILDADDFCGEFREDK